MKRFHTTFALVLLLTGGLVGWNRFQEPRHEGKPFSFWFKSWVEARGFNARPPEAFRHMGAAAVPYLIKALKKQDSILHRYYQDSFHGLPESAQKRLPNPIPAHVIRWKGARALAELGPEARQSLPGLIKLLHDPEPRVRSATVAAIRAMGNEGRPAAPFLVDALEIQDRWFRYALALTLVDYDDYPPHAAPRIAEALIDLIRYQETVSPQALEALARVRPVTPEAFLYLLGALHEQEQFFVRYNALLLESSLDLRTRIFDLLAAWAQEHSFSAPLLIEKTSDADEIMRALAVEVLSSDSSALERLLSHWPSLLNDSSPFVRFNTAVALHRLGGLDIRQHQDVVVDVLKSNNALLKRRVRTFLESIPASHETELLKLVAAETDSAAPGVRGSIRIVPLSNVAGHANAALIRSDTGIRTLRIERSP